MTTKRLSIFSLLIFFLLSASAQMRFEVVSFERDMTDLKASTRARQDANNRPTALVKVQIPIIDNMVIDSNYKIGDQDYTPGEYLVYLAEGCKRVTLKHPDFMPLEYTFPEPLESKVAYKLILKVPDDYVAGGLVSVELTTNVRDAKVIINDKTHETSNGEFIIRLKPGSYAYTLSTPTPGFNPDKGTITITEEDLKEKGFVDKFITLSSDKKSNLHIKAHDGSVVMVDNQKVNDWKKKAVTLPLGIHSVKVSLGDFHKTFTVNLTSDNQELDADLRQTLIIKNPSDAEFVISPLGNAFKPSVTKFKSNQPVKVLGKYSIQAKKKGYEPASIEIEAYPGNENFMVLNIPMVSNAHNIYYGKGSTKPNPSKGKKEFQSLISKGDDMAMWELGTILLDEGNSQLANTYIQRAAAKDNPLALMYVAVGATDVADRRNKLSRAAENGAAIAHKILGDSYSLETPLDYNKAYKEYSLFDDSYTRLKRAEILLADRNIEHNGDIVELLNGISPADELSNKAKAIIGDLYYSGVGLPQNTAEAFKIWKASNLSDLSDNALLILAVENIDSKLQASNYLRHVNLDAFPSNFVVHKGVDLITLLRTVGLKLANKDADGDLAESFRLINGAYSLGDTSWPVLRRLGKSYKDGEGTAKNQELAKKILNDAITKYDQPEAIRWLGNIYENEKNTRLAEQCYLKAIEKGDNAANGFYGTLLYNKRDMDGAVKFWSAAGLNGYKPAIKNLVTYYEKVNKNAEKLNFWKSKL